MKSIIALLAGYALGWKIDLRAPSPEPIDLYMSPGDNVEIVLSGSTWEGCKWQYFLTNNYAVHFTGQEYSHEPDVDDY
jgi:hypothetical protein